MSEESALTIKDVLQQFFRKHNLGDDGGLNKTWGRIKVGPIYLPILNIPARRKALVFHDIHHIVTGFAGDWKGEVSISAWELSTGCGKYWAAWILDLWGMAIGLFIYPTAVYNAFIWGKVTHNLYRNNIPHEQALNMKPEELKKELLLDSPHPQHTNAEQKKGFLLFSILALVSFILPFVVAPAFLLWMLVK